METLDSPLTPEQLARLFYKYPLNGFPILDDSYNFSGVLQKRYIVNSINEFRSSRMDARRIIEKHVYYPSEGEIVRMIFGDRKIQEFPVLHRHGFLMGVWELSSFFRIFDKQPFSGYLNFRKIFNVMPFPVFITDEKERLLTFNAAMSAASGLTWDENTNIGRRLVRVFESIAWELLPRDANHGEVTTPDGDYKYRNALVEQENGKELTLYILLAESAAVSPSAQKVNPQADSCSSVQGASSLNGAVEALEKKMIQDAMHIHENNISQAAIALDLPRQTLQYKLAKYRI
jgi:transcriptional regulator with PAS, ATPase and Fis domain